MDYETLYYFNRTAAMVVEATEGAAPADIELSSKEVNLLLDLIDELSEAYSKMSCEVSYLEDQVYDLERDVECLEEEVVTLEDQINELKYADED